MPDYWLDANVFITSKNTAYGFDIAPGFWKSIEQKAAEGTIGTSAFVYREIIDRTDDDLADWLRAHKDLNFCVEPSLDSQLIYADIANHVISGDYSQREAARFLNGADPWLIAQAKSDGGSVVTLEALAGPGTTKVKIPNICQQFGVPFINTYQLLRALNIVL